MKRSLPLALRVVAFLFILGGISAVMEVITSIINNRLNINFGVLGIFIGLGLFRLRQGWRTCALVFTWMSLIMCPIIGFVFLGHSGPLDFTIFGQKAGYAPKEFGVVMIVVLFVYTFWQYRVLTRRDVRLLFMNDDGREASIGVHSALFSNFLLLHPEFKLADSRLQWNAFHKWLNDPHRRGDPASNKNGELDVPPNA